eukprot:TRINITY_DN1185_c0_g1_i2.p1 TRINITY_DN1185_c0_g1~~TRINITY_DN1185_c0_g1_i2.p1  ORF type:complete len:133 (-),score=53.01 TRINITY_DN1185_c0_g1_i2:53-451(-)
MCLYLNSVEHHNPEILATGDNIVGNVIIDESAEIGEDCLIGPNVVIGKDCVVKEGTRLSRTTIMSGSKIGSNSWIQSSIVGWQCNVGSWVRMEGVSVLGEDVKIKDELYINGGRVLPHKTIKESIPEPKIIM